MRLLISRLCWTLALTSTFATPSFAQLVSFLPAFDATLLDQDLDATFESGNTSNPVNDIRRTDGVVNQGYLFEFDVSGVGANSMVTSASLFFEVLDPPRLPGDIAILAYQADGILTLPDDGDRPSLSAGSFDPVSLGSGTVSVTLDANVINILAMNGDFIGIRMQGAENDALSTIRGIQTTLPGDPPTLLLDVTTVPEPSALPLLFMATISVAMRYRPMRFPIRDKCGVNS